MRWAETSVCAAAIDHPEIVELCRLTPEMFVYPDTRAAWQFILDASERGEPWDAWTVMDGAGLPPSAVSGWLVDHIGPHAAWSVHARKIRHAHYRDEAEKAAEQITLAVADGKGAEAFTDAAARLAALEADSEGVRLPTIGEIASLRMRAYEEGVGKGLGVQTGFRQLDDVMGGLPRGVPTVLGARPGVGKTSVSLNLALGAAQRGTRVLVVTYEDSGATCTDRAISILSHVPAQSIRRGEMAAHEMRKLTDAIVTLKQLPVYFDEHRGNVQQMVRRVRKTIAQHDIGCVFIDYVQKIPKVDYRMGVPEHLDQCMFAIADGALDTGVPWVVCSQINRDSDKEKRPPTMADLRGSGGIEIAGKFIVLIHRPNMRDDREVGSTDDNALELRVVKNFQGPRNLLRFGWHGPTMRVIEQ